MTDDAYLDRLLRALVDTKRDAERKRIEHEEAKRRQAAAERDVLEVIMERRDKSVTRDLGPGYDTVRFVPNATPYGTVINEKKAVESLAKLGHGPGTFERKIRKKVLNDLAKEANDHGADLPEGVGFYVKRYVTVTET